MNTPKLIHPYDVFLLLNKLETIDFSHINDPTERQFIFGGTLYQQSLDVAPTEAAIAFFDALRS